MTEATGPLRGIRVLDFSQFLAGPYASYLLASLGATVIKVERPGVGDAYRAAGPPFIGDSSVPFFSVSLGKKSMSLDLARPEARPVLERLVRSSDVVVVGGVPTALSKIGLDPGTVRGFRSDVIYAAISGYGLRGPKSHLGALDLVIQAASGLMSVTGEASSAGHRMGVPITDYGTGMYAALAIVSALRSRDLTGEGAEVDASLFGTAVSWGAIPLLHYQVTGESQPRTGNVHPHIAPYQVVATSDGHIALSAPSDAAWSRLVDAIGAPELVADVRYCSNAARTENRTALTADLERHFAWRSSSDWTSRLTDAGIPCGPVQSHAALLDDAEWHDQASLLSSRSGTEEFLVPSRAFTLDGSTTTPDGPPPALGQHTAEVLQSIGFEASEIARFSNAGIL